MEHWEGTACDGETTALGFPEAVEIRDSGSRWVRNTCCAEVFEELFECQ